MESFCDKLEGNIKKITKSIFEKKIQKTGQNPKKLEIIVCKL